MSSTQDLSQQPPGAGDMASASCGSGGAVDCSSESCWSNPTCAAQDVATLATGLVPCGAPIIISATKAQAACTTLMSGAIKPMPAPGGKPQPIDCTMGQVTATVQLYCDAQNTHQAAWIDSLITLPGPESPAAETEVVYQCESVGFLSHAESGGTVLATHSTVDQPSSNVPGSVSLSHNILVTTALTGDIPAEWFLCEQDTDTVGAPEVESSFWTGVVQFSIPAP
jgi:hypothetical protein